MEQKPKLARSQVQSDSMRRSSLKPLGQLALSSAGPMYLAGLSAMWNTAAGAFFNPPKPTATYFAPPIASTASPIQKAHD